MESQEPTTDIISAARKHRMFQPGDNVLVAVSGGPDSVAMLYALHAHAEELGISLHSAHLNHQIRAEQSNLDEAFVREFAQSLKLPITFERVDVPALCRELKVGVEEAARIARLEFLQKTAADIGADKIAIGHTSDDRAESVLLNIIRGCGIDGLAAMPPVSGNIVRPLIETTRVEIEAYVAARALPYRVDESNLDVTYARNRIRHEILPILAREFNPDIKGALVRLAKIASAQSDLIAEMAQAARVEIGCEHSLNVKLFLRLPEALQHELLRLEIQRVKGDLVDITFDRVRGIVSGLERGADFTTTLPPGNIDAIHKDGEFSIRRREVIPEVKPFGQELWIGGITKVDAVGLEILAEVVTQTRPARLGRNQALINANAVVGALRVRNPEPGDQIVPLGMTGRKKLQDIFVDKKIPRPERARAAVVCDDEKILWVVGVVTSERGKVTEDTDRAILLTAAPDR